MGASMNGRSLDLISAPFTAMHEDGNLDLGKIEDQARSLARDGLRGAFVCGTTGEGASLTTTERKQVAERWCEVAEGLEVIVHVGHTSLREARSLAGHAESIGAAAIAAVAPFYHRPQSIMDLVDFCAELAEAAPQTPFYYYHIPSMTGVGFLMADFLRAARERVPTLAGIKYTHDDLTDYARCLEIAGDRYEVFFGRDEMLLSASGSRGARGGGFHVQLRRIIVHGGL